LFGEQKFIVRDQQLPAGIDQMIQDRGFRLFRRADALREVLLAQPFTAFGDKTRARAHRGA